MLYKTSLSQKNTAHDSSQLDANAVLVLSSMLGMNHVSDERMEVAMSTLFNPAHFTDTLYVLPLSSGAEFWSLFFEYYKEKHGHDPRWQIVCPGLYGDSGVYHTVPLEGIERLVFLDDQIDEGFNLNSAKRAMRSTYPDVNMISGLDFKAS